MTQTTVRVTGETHTILQQLARESHEPMQQVLAAAVEAYRRQRVVEATNSAYAVLHEDPAAWHEIVEERAAWDTTLADGLAPA